MCPGVRPSTSLSVSSHLKNATRGWVRAGNRHGGCWAPESRPRGCDLGRDWRAAPEVGGLGKVRADGKETRAAWRVWGVRRHRTGRQGSGLNADEQVSSCSSRGVPSQVSGSGHGGHSAPRPRCEPGRRRHGHCSATAGQCWAPTRVTSRPREPPDGPSAPEPRPPCPLRCPRVLTGRSAPPGSCRPTRGRHGLDTPLREVGATFAVPPALKGKALALRGTETTTRRPGPGAASAACDAGRICEPSAATT